MTTDMLRNQSLAARDLLVAARTVVAATDDDDRHPQARILAVASARASGARVLLYDIGSASPLSSPLPNEWASEVPVLLISVHGSVRHAAGGEQPDDR